MADDLLELAKIPPCDAGVFKLEMVEGGVSEELPADAGSIIWRNVIPGTA
jgi:hypothetical protein